MGAVSFISKAVVSICLLEISGDKAGSWMPFAQGMFGLGALLAPLVLRFTAVDSYYIFAALNLIMSLLFLYYPSPQHN